MIAGDVNGDGYLNDRAFVFDPARTATPASPRRCDPAGERRARRESVSGEAIGRLVGRATCQSPWVTTANLRLNLNPQKVRLPKRATISINFTNPLAIADLIAHGSNDTHGWGQDIPPDQNFCSCAASTGTRQFKYSVNDRFGSTRPQQSASRSAAFVSLNVSYDIGFARTSDADAAARCRPRAAREKANARY